MNNNDDIKQYLSELILQKNQGYFCLHIGSFTIFIFPCRSDGYSSFSNDDCITRHERLDISVHEKKRNKNGENLLEGILLENDTRFANYNSIKYSKYSGLSSGLDMPILNLCELIKYLYRLSNLAAFA